MSRPQKAGSGHVAQLHSTVYICIYVTRFGFGVMRGFPAWQPQDVWRTVKGQPDQQAYQRGVVQPADLLTDQVDAPGNPI